MVMTINEVTNKNKLAKMTMVFMPIWMLFHCRLCSVCIQCVDGLYVLLSCSFDILGYAGLLMLAHLCNSFGTMYNQKRCYKWNVVDISS